MEAQETSVDLPQGLNPNLLDARRTGRTGRTERSGSPILAAAEARRRAQAQATRRRGRIREAREQGFQSRIASCGPTWSLAAPPMTARARPSALRRREAFLRPSDYASQAAVGVMCGLGAPGDV